MRQKLFREEKKVLLAILPIRVASFFLVQNTKKGKIYQMGIKYFQRPYNSPNGHKIYQDPKKFTQIGIFGLKTNNLATLLPITDR
jgi:hypothetical protein